MAANKSHVFTQNAKKKTTNNPEPSVVEKEFGENHMIYDIKCKPSRNKPESSYTQPFYEMTNNDSCKFQRGTQISIFFKRQTNKNTNDANMICIRSLP